MKRIDGYIDLNSILSLPSSLRIVSRKKSDLKWMGPLAIEGDIAELNIYLSSRKDVEVVKSFGGDSLIVKFIYDDGNVYYFNYDNDCTPYGDLIYGCICDDLGIAHIDYDVARLGFLEGTLSKDYVRENVKYITGKTLLCENGGIDLEFSPWDREMAKRYGRDDVIFNKTVRYNSLEGIWSALENRFKDEPDLVKSLMGKIVDMYVVDILTAQNDRHSENWTLTEENGNINVHPIFDNRRIFLGLPYIASIAMYVDNQLLEDGKDDLETSVRKFISQSSSEFVQKLKDSLWVLSEENFEKIVERIENKTGFPFPIKLRDSFKIKFRIQLEFLQELLGIEEETVFEHKSMTMLPKKGEAK